MKEIIDFDFLKDKRIFITGSTGFKGSWLCKILTMLGAQVTGYALEPDKIESLFNIAGIENDIDSEIGDIRDFDHLFEVFDRTKPEIVFHLAAQPLVRESYLYPRYTYETNVMGTVNILECVRRTDSVRSFLNVTTDKVYKNRESEMGYIESDELDGYDPYSNSKSCSELVTHSYKQSFLDGKDRKIAISTARAGNVIGGGDFAKDRIIPDCIRAVSKGNKIVIRNPYSIRPYQHVLEPLFAYIMIAMAQYDDSSLSGSYNVGPNEEECCSTSKLVDIFVREWGGKIGWIEKHDDGPHEASYLKLNCSKIKNTLGWHPIWGIDVAVKKTIEWAKSYLKGEDIRKCMDKQIYDYIISLKRD